MISVIIPTYKNPSALENSLKTWMGQSISQEEFEVIVADNNSSDETETLVLSSMEKCSNVTYICEKKSGATNARHAGVRCAKGDILVFADDDGLYNPECLSEIERVYKENPEVDAVACKIQVKWMDGEQPEWIAPYLFMLGQLDYGPEIKTAYDLFFNSGLFSIRRSVFEDLGGFNPDLVGGKLIGDGDTGLVIKMHETHKLIGWTPYAVMQHMQSVSKHGSEKGVALHFYNIGIGDSYALFRKNNFGFTSPVRKYMAMSLALFAKKAIEYYLLQSKGRKVYFSLKQRWGQICFFINLLNREIRKEVMEKQNGFAANQTDQGEK